MNRYRKSLSRLLALVVVCSCAASVAMAQPAGPRFEISFPASVHAGPITGRVYVILSSRSVPEPRLRVGSWEQQTPFFGVDVEQLKAGEAAVIDEHTLGYPATSLKDVPPGDYHVQALINVYTEFHRADGHTIWAHMDQWEGQQFNRSPGNLYSDVRKVNLDPGVGYNVKLELTKIIPPVKVPQDTKWVRRIKIPSELLTRFWGHPMYLGATVLLPKGYDQDPSKRYPVVYVQGHFDLDPPFEGPQAGGSLFPEWTSDDFPRMIAVTFQHPTPYFDDSYAVNSANNGPYGDALIEELIPYIEQRFRILRKPYARMLTGGSTGGWESLALQVFHPDFFGGTWTFYPDPIDFRRYQLVNIYEDDNAFLVSGFRYMIPERPMMRTVEGQVVHTMRQMSQLEEVLGSKGRSGQQYEAWEAAYGPTGKDGYPRPLWNKKTGEIDHEVSNYMRDHGYDLSHYIRTNWGKLRPKLENKLHLYCGDMDNYYLNLAVYLLEDFLEHTNSGSTFEYGRPMKGHGWQPMTNAGLIKLMADQIRKNAPEAAAASNR